MGRPEGGLGGPRERRRARGGPPRDPTLTSSKVDRNQKIVIAISKFPFCSHKAKIRQISNKRKNQRFFYFAFLYVLVCFPFVSNGPMVQDLCN